MPRKLFWLGLATLLSLPVVQVSPSSADDKKPAALDKDEARAADVEMLTEAYRLAEIAEREKWPEAYIAAGSLVLKVKALCKGELGQFEPKIEVQDENGKPIPGAKVEARKPESLDSIAQDFFDAASALGKTLKVSPAVEALIKAAKARTYGPGTRGAVGGPKVFMRTLGPHQTHVFDVLFDTHSVGTIGFQSTAPTRCKMQIGDYVHFDQVVRVGNYVWKPRPDVPRKAFAITVHNPQDVPVTYKVFTN
jgi:hypothetical protein